MHRMNAVKHLEFSSAAAILKIAPPICLTLLLLFGVCKNRREVGTGRRVFCRHHRPVLDTVNHGLQEGIRHLKDVVRDVSNRARPRG